MLFSIRTAALLSILATSASAAIVERNSPVRNNLQCSTHYCPHSYQHVPTSTKTSVITSTKTKTVTPTTTITGDSPVVTITQTATVISTVSTSIAGTTETDTASAFVTLTSTASPAYVTVTSTSTVTTIVSTSLTVPTAAGFQPASGTIPGSTTSFKKRDLLNGSSPVRRGLAVTDLDITPVANGPPLIKIKSGQNEKRTAGRHPDAVLCTTFKTTIITSTKTAAALTLTKPGIAATSTRTAIVSTQVVETQTGPASTVTVSEVFSSISSITPTSTVTTVSTTTAMSTSYTATAYAACASGTSDNLVYIAGNNSPINGISTNLQSVDANANSATACCNACFADPQCALSAYTPVLGTCYLVHASSVAACNAPSAFSGAVEAEQPGDGGDPIYVLSNGNCGQFNSVVTGQGAS